MPIIIKGENAVLDGGFRVKNFKPVIVNGVNALCAEIDPERAKTLLFDQLFINGGRRYRSVFPESKHGFSGLVKERNGMRKMVGAADWLTSNSIFDSREKIPTLSRIEDIEFHVCHCWVHERMKVAKIDYDNNRIYTQTGTRFCVLDKEFGALVNVFETLKALKPLYRALTN